MESTISTERNTMMNRDITIGVICFWIFFLKVSLKLSFLEFLLFLLTVLTPSKLLNLLFWEGDSYFFSFNYPSF